MGYKTVLCLVDREGNKKNVTISHPAAVDPAALIVAFEAQTGAKLLSYSQATSGRVLDDTFEAGDFDTVGHAAVLRFVDEDNRAFRFSVPAPIDAFDENEEVLAAFAETTKAYLEAFRGDTLQYRGGSLVSKRVSQPLTIPDLESEE